MADEKDGWDKLEVAAKALGAVLIPAVLGFAAWDWNTSRSELNAKSAMLSIAVSVLTEVPKEEDGETDPLREWAIAVMQSPDDPPAFNDAAASVLTRESIPPTPSDERLNLWALGTAVAALVIESKSDLDEEERASIVPIIRDIYRSQQSTPDESTASP